VCADVCVIDEDDDNRYAQDEYGDQPFHDHGYEDLADAASGKGAFDVMLTTYTLFERVGASNRCAEATGVVVVAMLSQMFRAPGHADCASPHAGHAPCDPPSSVRQAHWHVKTQTHLRPVPSCWLTADRQMMLPCLC
jgi:hypothetical protein